MKICTALVILAGINAAGSFECQLPKEKLNPQRRTGQFKPKNYPNGYVGGQTCPFTLPYEKYSGQLLLIYIKEMDMISPENSNATGSIKLADGDFFSVKKKENCRLYGKGAENVSPASIKAIIDSEYVCTAWVIDEMSVKTLTFRSNGEKHDTFNANRFLVTYEYIAVPSTEVTPVKETTRTHEQVETTTEQSTSSSENTSDSPSTTPYIIAIVALLALLVLVLFVFLLDMYKRKQRHRKQRIARGSFFQSESIDDQVDDQPSTSHPYATVENSGNSKQTDKNNPAYVHDTPTTSRNNRASTGASSKEPHYQVPKSKAMKPGISTIGESHYATAEEAAPNSPNPSDVYAMVRKDKKQKGGD